MEYTPEELTSLFIEYLLTLNNESYDEEYGTERYFTAYGFTDFINWLNAREQLRTGVNMS